MVICVTLLGVTWGLPDVHCLDIRLGGSMKSKSIMILEFKEKILIVINGQGFGKIR